MESYISKISKIFKIVEKNSMQFDRRWYRNTCNDCLENVSVDVRNENSNKVVVVSVEHVGSLEIQLKVGLGFSPDSRVKIYQLKGTSLFQSICCSNFYNFFLF